MFNKMLFLTVCAISPLLASSSISKEMITKITEDWRKSTDKVDESLGYLHAGLIGLNNPEKVFKDYTLYARKGDLPKEDKDAIEKILFLCKADPHFGLKQINTNEGYIKYKKILSDYTYVVEDALKQQKNLELAVEYATKEKPSAEEVAYIEQIHIKK